MITKEFKSKNIMKKLRKKITDLSNTIQSYFNIPIRKRTTTLLNVILNFDRKYGDLFINHYSFMQKIGLHGIWAVYILLYIICIIVPLLHYKQIGITLTSFILGVVTLLLTAACGWTYMKTLYIFGKKAYGKDYQMQHMNGQLFDDISNYDIQFQILSEILKDHNIDSTPEAYEHLIKSVECDRDYSPKVKLIDSLGNVKSVANLIFPVIVSLIAIIISEKIKELDLTMQHLESGIIWLIWLLAGTYTFASIYNLVKLTFHREKHYITLKILNDILLKMKCCTKINRKE